MLTKCLGMNDAYRAIQWKVFFLIMGLWPLSTAIRSTGLADTIIQFFLLHFGSVPPLSIAALLTGLAMLLTQFMGGQVASLVLAPLAISSAQIIGENPRSMGIAVALGCSLAFPLPFGHPVNLMVMEPGGYRIGDYLRIGLSLTILIFLIILFGLDFFWGL